MKQALLHPSYSCHYTEFPGETQLSVSENSQQNHLPADAGLCALRCMVPRHELAQLLQGEDISKICGLKKRVKIEEWRVEITKKAPFSERNPQIVWSEAPVQIARFSINSLLHWLVGILERISIFCPPHSRAKRRPRRDFPDFPLFSRNDPGKRGKDCNCPQPAEKNRKIPKKFDFPPCRFRKKGV